MTSVDTTDPDAAGTPARRPPFWRRPRRLRRQITGTLVVTSLIAIVLFGALNYVAANQLLNEGVKSQLDSVAASRARSIELGTQRLLNQVGTIATDLGVVASLDELATTYESLDATLDAGQLDELEDFYQQRVVDPINEANLLEEELTVDDAIPTSETGRYVQYHHTISESASGDDSAYASAVAESDDYLRALAESIRVGDLLLVSADDDIVYSTEKRIDLGTSLVDGPYARGALGTLVVDTLERVRVGSAAMTNFTIYVPGGASPTLFAATTVRSGTEIIGSLVVVIPGEALDAITTANQNWDAVGLAEGESYVVSSGLRLQSTSREWIENPQGYLDRTDDPALKNAIEQLDTPVALQVVDTEPVRSAFRGEPFSGRAKNYLGQSTQSSSTTIDIAGVEWAVVTDVPVSAVREPLIDYVKRMAIVVLIVIPIAGLIGLALARRLSRPIGPAVEAAQSVAAGARTLDLPRLGRDEYGDLGRRLTRMAAVLAGQEQDLADEYERRRQLLLAVLPPHLVDDDGAVSGSGDRVDIATAVSIAVEVDENLEADDELAEHLAAAATAAERLAAENSIDRVRVAADRYLFISGAGRTDDGAASGLAFARALADELEEGGADAGLQLHVRTGISTGPVATGVLERGSLTFGAWGEPVRRALAINALSKRDEILVDAPTAALVDDEMIAVAGIVDLDDEPMELYSLADRVSITGG